jgi:hypothetical protein
MILLAISAIFFNLEEGTRDLSLLRDFNNSKDKYILKEM